MEDCIFCKIVRGEVGVEKVYEDDHVIAFLDIMPANAGHCLVIPKKHYETLIETPDEELEKLILATKKLAKAVARAVKAHGYNILQNNYEAAGQQVRHLHFHVIPRFNRDGINLHWKPLKQTKQRLAELKKDIIANIIDNQQ